jgi:hypothetical protein
MIFLYFDVVKRMILRAIFVYQNVQLDLMVLMDKGVSSV